MLIRPDQQQGHRADRDAGFSFLEVMIALVVMIPLVLLATSLLHESSVRVTASGARALDLPVELILDRLRADLRNASGVVDPGTLEVTELWYDDEPLVLVGRAGVGTVGWALRDGELARTVVGESPVSQLRGVVGFRWRPRYDFSRSVVELELDVAQQGGARGAGTSTRLREQQVHTVHLLATPRRRAVSTWW